jgi:hypothetical protein
MMYKPYRAGNALIIIIALALTLSSCKKKPIDSNTSIMIRVTPRIDALFSKTKTICFGRFAVDVPEATLVVWADAALPLEVKVYPGEWDRVRKLAMEFEQELREEKAIYHDDAPLLLSAANLEKPEGRIITGYESFESINDVRVRAYFKLDDDGVVVKASPLREDVEDVTSQINSIARRLRHRSAHDLPIEPGNCLEHAFLPDEVNVSMKSRVELMRLGFRLREFPDTHLSLFLSPSNPHFAEGNSLEWQLDQLEKRLRLEYRNHPRLTTRYLRRGARKLNDWLDGFEALSRTPDVADAHGIHDFAMAFRGTPTDPYKPYVDIRMQTGVKDNVAGNTKVSMTDDEAVAVWDRITSTIRIRPTGAPIKKTTADSPLLPLGELAATGRICPQTGWWQSSEASGIDGGGRRHVTSGERMPHVTLATKPSLWQKLKGEHTTYRASTTWKLVEYGDDASNTDLPTPKG